MYIILLYSKYNIFIICIQVRTFTLNICVHIMNTNVEVKVCTCKHAPSAKLTDITDHKHIVCRVRYWLAPVH